MPDLQRVHRFRDHAVAGIKWRPTRFVDEVPSSRVCGLCSMIPKRTVLLPCSHVLCQSCHVANSEGSGGRCPLDQEPFTEAECGSYDFPARKANAFKVHCWNETHGCEFEGAIKFMLRHYENECSFHTVECLRCGEQVLHRELSTHCAAGCSVAVSSARTGNAPSHSQALILRDVAAAHEELKTLLRDANHEQLLLAIQSQMNELIEQIRNQKSMSAVITQDVAASETSQVAQVIAPCPSSSLQEGNSRQDPNEEGTAPSTSRSRSKKKSKRPEGGPLVDLPEEVLRFLRKTDLGSYPLHAITQVYQGVECNLKLSRWSSSIVTWWEVLEKVKYVLTLANLSFDGHPNAPKFADIKVLHTRDSYFTVEVYSRHFDRTDIFVRITFHGIRRDSRCRPPLFLVYAYNLRSGEQLEMDMYRQQCDCEHDSDSWAHARFMYHDRAFYKRPSVILEDALKFEIELWPTK